METRLRDVEERTRFISAWLRSEMGFDSDTQGNRWRYVLTIAKRVRRLRAWQIQHETEVKDAMRRFEKVEGLVTGLVISRAKLLGALAAASFTGGSIQWLLSLLAAH